jgi:aspartate/methionine/tyrosine aminotransferase
MITERTKAVLLNSPGNPSGVVMSEREVNDLLDLCRSRGVVLISDEIYDEFTFSEARTQRASDASLGMRCPSPCRVAGSHEDVLLIRGFGKTYGVTGWRLGFAAGPAWLIDAMTRVQQYTFVCAPSPLQYGVAECFETDITAEVADYERRRDMVVSILGEVTNVASPGGAFYAFAEVPAALGMTGRALAAKLIERGVFVIPGGAFSRRDTHIRLSMSASPERLERGVRIIAEMMRGG